MKRDFAFMRTKVHKSRDEKNCQKSLCQEKSIEIWNIEAEGSRKGNKENWWFIDLFEMWDWTLMESTVKNEW